MKKRSVGLVIIIILIACNMRSPFTGVGALTALIRADLGISNTVTGMLTTIPMLVFAVISAAAPVLSRRIGLGRCIQLSLLLVFAGEMIRSFTGTVGLFIGTGVLCVGIGLENVLLISVVKQWFPENPAPATSAYSTTMAVMAAISIAISVYMAKNLGLGWRGSLAVWAVFAVIASLLWLPMAGKPEMRPKKEEVQSREMGALLRSPRTWILTVFFGTQSLLFYCMNAWGPTILQSRGFTLEQSSAAATFLQVVSLPITLAAPLLAKRFTARRMLIILGTCYVIGGVLFYFAVSPVMVYISFLLFAQGMGSTFSFCLLFFAQMGRNPQETASISGIAQSGGYVVSAIGPVLMGALADISGAWNWPVIFLLAMLVIAVFTGVLSSREGTILS